MSKMKGFWSDKDGISTKDALIIAFTGVYLLEQLTAFFITIFFDLSKDTMNVIAGLDNVVMTIILSTFGVQTVKEIQRHKLSPPVDNEEVSTKTRSDRHK